MPADANQAPRQATSVSPQGLPTRADLIDLAAGIIAERGLGALTFRSLATTAGCSTTPIVKEFPTRNALLEAVFEDSWIRAGIKKSEVDSATPLDTLYEVCSRAVPVKASPDPSVRAYFELLFETARNPELKEFVSRIENAGQRDYIELIKRCQAMGEIDPGLDPEDVLYAIWSLGDGLCLDAYTYPEEFTPSRTKRVWELGFRAIVSASAN